MFKIGKTNSLKFSKFSGEGHVIIDEDFLEEPAFDRLDILGDWIDDLTSLYEQAHHEAHHSHIDETGEECPCQTTEYQIDNCISVADSISNLLKQIKEKGAEFKPHEQSLTIGQLAINAYYALFHNMLRMSEDIHKGDYNKIRQQVIDLESRRPRKGSRKSE